MNINLIGKQLVPGNIYLQQGDNNVETICFRVERYCGDVDFSKLHAAVVSSDGEHTNRVITGMDNSLIMEISEQSVLLKWKAGTVVTHRPTDSMAFQLAFYDDGGDLVWHSSTGTIIVRESLNAESITVEYPDMFLQIENKIRENLKQCGVAVNQAQEQAQLSGEHAGDARSQAVISKENALLSTSNVYETAQDAQQTGQDAQVVGQKLQQTEENRRKIEEMISGFRSEKGAPDGIASLDSLSHVVQDAGNALKLGGEPPEHYAQAQALNVLIPQINDKVCGLTYSPVTGKLSAEKSGSAKEYQITGLLDSVTEDTTNGDVSFHYRGGGKCVWHKGRDNFVQTAYLDSQSNEIVMAFTAGNEIRINISSLVDIYTGGETNTALVTVEGYAVHCDIKLSPDSGNILEAHGNGLYAKTTLLSDYSTTAQNDAKYLGLNAAAKNSEKLNGKTETQLLVSGAKTADKWSSARTITIEGCAVGTGQVDGSADTVLTLQHKNSPFVTLTAPSDPAADVAVNAALIEKAVLVLTQSRRLRIDGAANGMILIIRVYGAVLDEAYLTAQGYEWSGYGTTAADNYNQNHYAEVLNTADYYEYGFVYDGVVKSMRRKTVIRGV